MEPALLLPYAAFAAAEGPVARRAARFDVVVLVGEPVDVAGRVEAYRELGVEVHVYPLPPTAAPTLVSLLGLSSWLRSAASRSGSPVLVEGVGGEAVVAASLLAGELGDARAAYGRVRSAGFELLEPLQLRVVAHSAMLSECWWGLAPRLEECAFTGCDAHSSSVAELALDLLASLGGGGAACSVAYSALLHRQCPLGELAAGALRVAAALDSTLTGAVRVVEASLADGRLRVRVGCSMLGRPESCRPEVGRASEALLALASLLGASGVEVEEAWPEEVACSLYGWLDEEMCRVGE